MSNNENKYDMYEFIIEKMILRKMKEENDAINCSLKKVQEFIQNNGSILNSKSNPNKNYSVYHTMEQKFKSYSSIADYYADMKEDIKELRQYSFDEDTLTYTAETCEL
jgi:(p)ppGpp synthase/HD superfamily hydrolase